MKLVTAGGTVLVSIIFAHRSGELLPVEGDMEGTRSIPSLQPVCLSSILVGI